MYTSEQIALYELDKTSFKQQQRELSNHNYNRNDNDLPFSILT